MITIILLSLKFTIQSIRKQLIKIISMANELSFVMSSWSFFFQAELILITTTDLQKNIYTFWTSIGYLL